MENRLVCEERWKERNCMDEQGAAIMGRSQPDSLLTRPISVQIGVSTYVDPARLLLSLQLGQTPWTEVGLNSPQVH